MSAAVRIHSLDHARAALAAAADLQVPVTLVSAIGAGAYAGPAWFEQVVAQAKAEFPSVAVTAILDCGDAAGPAMAAIRLLAEPGRTPVAIHFTGDALARIADMARQGALNTADALPPTLDLREVRDPIRECRAWLAGQRPKLP